MIRAEKEIRIRNLGLGPINDLLQTSHQAVRAYEIPIAEALWSKEQSRLTYHMTTSEFHQGHRGICFGGFMDVALHTATGVAASIRAMELWGKPVLAQGFLMTYRRPIPLYHEVAVEAIAHTLPAIGRRRLLSFGRIMDADTRSKVFTIGCMWLTVVDRVLIP